jgi:lysophospholipase L1-like esterase
MGTESVPEPHDKERRLFAAVKRIYSPATATTFCDMDSLIGFGASTMQGAGDSQGGFFKRLETKLAQAGSPRRCINYGVGGDSTRDMLARFGKLRPHLPSAAIVLLGSNDIPRDGDPWPQNRLPLPDYRVNVEIILKAFVHPGTLFVSSFLICPERTGMHPEVFAEYMGAALKIAASLDLAIWDLYAESLAFGGNYFAPDGVHYNDAGHEMIAERVWRMIKNSSSPL